MLGEQGEVALVSLEREVEQITDERDEADDRVGREVHQHARDHDRRHPAARRDHHRVSTEQRADHVAAAGNHEAEDRIDEVAIEDIGQRARAIELDVSGRARARGRDGRLVDRLRSLFHAIGRGGDRSHGIQCSTSCATRWRAIFPGMAVAVLTRDPVDAQGYASVLGPLGLDVVAMPVTRFSSAPDPDALARALDRTGYAAIVVASPRAAHELARATNHLAGARTTLPELPEIWAVGPATKRALDIAKLPATVPPNVRDSAELARHLVAARELSGKHVLVPRAEDGRVEALQILRAAGAEVTDVIAYRTLAVAPDDAGVQAGADLLVRGEAAICAVFAPSQVTALAAVLAARGVSLASVATPFCAIGETTASALRAAGVADVAVAPAPTPEGMAQAVRSVYPAKA